MPWTKFSVEVLTPEGEVFNDEVEMVSTVTTIGSIGLRANHQPILAMLEPTELRLYKNDLEIVRFAQAEGYMQVTKERTLILVEEAHEPENLDVADLRERVERAERELQEAGDDSEKERVARRDKNRAEKFLSIAGGA